MAALYLIIVCSLCVLFSSTAIEIYREYKERNIEDSITEFENITQSTMEEHNKTIRKNKFTLPIVAAKNNYYLPIEIPCDYPYYSFLQPESFKEEQMHETYTY